MIPPELEVKKNTSQYEWKTGDIIDYEVLVSQTKQDVKAVNVVITDELPSCLQLLEGQYATETSQGGENCTLTGRPISVIVTSFAIVPAVTLFTTIR